MILLVLVRHCWRLTGEAKVPFFTISGSDFVEASWCWCISCA
ncbi:hypothetical protein O9992_05640 [Vibrio lentus]|nr:hypothetical protein [Vibrio lentus]